MRMQIVMGSPYLHVRESSAFLVSAFFDLKLNFAPNRVTVRELRLLETPLPARANSAAWALGCIVASEKHPKLVRAGTVSGGISPKQRHFYLKLTPTLPFARPVST